MNPSRRKVLKVTGIAVSAHALGLTPAIAQVPAKIIIARLPYNTTHTMYQGASDWFKEEGLTVEYFMSPAGPAVVQALASGSVPVGEIGVGPAIISAVRNLPFVSPALGATCTPKNPWQRIMVRKDSSIRSVQDLKGKKVAVVQRGTMSDLETIAMGKTHGVGLEDIELTLVPAPNMPQVLEQGQVDAIWVLPPFDTVAERTFAARTIVNDSDIIPYVGYNTLTYRSDFVDAYPEAAKKIMKVWIKLARWIDDNPAKANAAVGKAIGVEDDLWPHLRLPYFARNALPVMPNVWHNYHLLVAGKILPPVDDPEKLLDETVVRPTRRITFPAIEELGGMVRDPEIVAMLRASYPLLPKPVESYYSDWEQSIVRP
jgi:NitT/TauT family transport system substrate-binding protein